MLDSHARKYVQPVIEISAKSFIKMGLSANQVTFIAFLIGASSGIFAYFQMPLIAVAVLWFSGFLDAVDGTIARTKGSTPFGTIMDVTFDRIVEISVIMGLALRYSESMIYLLALACSIIITMTIFLTTGIMSSKYSEKSFYYQAGLAERTEGFIMFSLMMLFPGNLSAITAVFTGMILFTVVQRWNEAKRLLDSE